MAWNPEALQREANREKTIAKWGMALAKATFLFAQRQNDTQKRTEGEWLAVDFAVSSLNHRRKQEALEAHAHFSPQ